MAYVDITPSIRPSDLSLVGYSRSEDIEAVKNSLKNIFLIRLGEVPGKPWFGNGLYTILFDPIDNFTTKFITEHIRNQLEKYEPRVQLVSLNVENKPEYNRIDVKMNYYVIIQDEKVYDSLIIKDLNTVSTARTSN